MSFDEEMFMNDSSVHPVLREGTRCEALRRALDACVSYTEKVATLRSVDTVDAFLASPSHAAVAAVVESMQMEDQYVLLVLPALGQEHVLTTIDSDAPTADLRARLSKMAEALKRVDLFYDSIGGVCGYQLKSLQLIAAGMEELRSSQATACISSETPAEVKAPQKTFLVPKAVDLAAEDGREVARAATLRGLRAMPTMAEIYPVGGAGDRLGLIDEVTGESLPAAMLPYCGRTMLEGLLRDLQAREHLYYRLTGVQLTTPVAIMTSDAKGNNARIVGSLERAGWFGRGKGAFRTFRQPMVPVISVDSGRWLLSGELVPMMKPGGHGAIWKLMKDEGVFDWLDSQSRSAALVRQISNPMAGMDTTLLALAGEGASRRASFGFMSCDRHVGAAEGVNVLQESRVAVTSPDGTPAGHRYAYNLTNIEYTEFDRLGITDCAAEGAPGAAQLSVFPANTNVLYVGLPAAASIVQSAVESGSSERLMPGLIFNLKKKVAYTDPLTGEETAVRAGRMESTMQNIADFFVDEFDAPLSPSEARAQLSTFLVYNHRRKVTSSAKKKREPRSTKISQTPDGSFYDLMRNAWHLLQLCGVQTMPELGSVEQYLARGPGFICLYHPALGPVWEVIAQKISGGALHQGSEMVLEVAEARLRNVDVRGSLLVRARAVVGHTARGADSGSHRRTHSPHHAHHTHASHASSHLTVHGLHHSEAGVTLGGLPPVPEAANGARGRSPSSGTGSRSDGAGHSDGGAGSSGEDRLVFSSRVGRVNLVNVSVANAGVDWAHAGNVYWKHSVARTEALSIELLGHSEFEARDVTIAGDHSFVVPDGYRMVVTQGAGGGIITDMRPLHLGRATWEWRYSVDTDGAIALEYATAPSSSTPPPPAKSSVVNATFMGGGSSAKLPASASAPVRGSGSVGAFAAQMSLSPLALDAYGEDTVDQDHVLEYIFHDVASWIV
ncbi:hypothetical protein FOA52_009306 [Chlamydomonas sp. UWO 241]|nr:hypothetical protein FOA52_009306 [Chlamydomonas sp. UWO 241]